MKICLVSTRSELLEALRETGPQIIRVHGGISDAPTLSLGPGQELEGAHAGASIRFDPDVDGLEITSGNRVANLALTASPDRRALFNDTSQPTLGRIVLDHLTLHGQLQIIASGRLRSGELRAADIHIRAADTRTRKERASGNGVWVLQGAFTLWNQQPAAESVITATLDHVRIGAPDAPVCGGGVFISGHAERNAGRVLLDRVAVESIYADSGLAPGTTSLVAAALFILHGAEAERVTCAGSIETLGANCVALDNWGIVDTWTAASGLRTHGPSAIAIINAGRLNILEIRGSIETFGEGARGMSIYADTGSVELGTVVTHGNAACGVHITRPMERLVVREGIATYGESGESLVKGHITRMPADGLSVCRPATIDTLEILGTIKVHGRGAAAIRTSTEHERSH